MTLLTRIVNHFAMQVVPLTTSKLAKVGLVTKGLVALLVWSMVKGAKGRSDCLGTLQL